MAIIRVLIVDGSPVPDSNLHRLLSEAADIYIAGHATTIEEMQFVLPHCDLMLVDTEIGQDQAIAFISAAHQSQSELKTIVVGVERRPDVILQYIEAGAVGYVLQQAPPQHVLRKVRLLDQDKAPVSPHMAARLIDRLAWLSQQQARTNPLAGETPGVSVLTPRQMEVLALVSQSLTNREIAEQLGIQRGTVKNHVHNILKRLELSSRQEAAELYLAHRDSLSTSRR
ncbi:MAG: response regulator transcription factor [Candidatus Promineifilaceae bacterium]|nr:response regulator transcription factor [Candidatus Promineifilaceae bacterium]